MVELDSPAGHVIVVRDAAYRGSNGDEVEWMVRNYGKYTRENEDGESETLLMLDDVTMTPELFRRYFQAAYTLEGRPVTIPGAPDRTAPAGGESPDTAFKSTIRIDTRIGKINRKLHRLPSQFSDEPRKLKRLPSQFDDDPKGIQIRNPSKAP